MTSSRTHQMSTAAIATGTSDNDDGVEDVRGGKRQTIAFPPSLRKNINRDHGDIILLVCYFITGLLDSASISKWGSFVSMQTGVTDEPITILTPKPILLAFFSRLVFHFALSNHSPCT